MSFLSDCSGTVYNVKMSVEMNSPVSYTVSAAKLNSARRKLTRVRNCTDITNLNFLFGFYQCTAHDPVQGRGHKSW